MNIVEASIADLRGALEAGKVTSVAYYERFDAHKLIEEMMILANVAAAEELTHLKRPLLFRVHEEPSPEKLDALRDVAVEGHRIDAVLVELLGHDLRRVLRGDEHQHARSCENGRGNESPRQGLWYSLLQPCSAHATR